MPRLLPLEPVLPRRRRDRRGPRRAPARARRERRGGAGARVAQRARRACPHQGRRLVGPAASVVGALARAAPRGGEGGEPPRPRGCRLPCRSQVGVHGEEPFRREVHRRQRRRRRPRLVHRQAADGVEPGALARGDGARRLCGRRGHRLRLRALGVPALEARARAGGCARVRVGRPRRRHPRQRLLVPRPRRGGRRLLRRRARRPRSSTRSRGCAAPSRRGRRSRRRRATTRSRRW